MAELVDALDLGSSIERCGGSSPLWGILNCVIIINNFKTRNHMEEFYKSLYSVQATLMHLYWKTWVYHWNVVGSDFQQYHSMFGEQYEFLAEELDKFSEHMRFYGIKALGPLSIVKDTSVIEDVQVNIDDKGMATDLLTDHQALLTELKKADKLAESTDNPQTCNLLQQMMEDHGKFIWMLRSILRF